MAGPVIRAEVPPYRDHDPAAVGSRLSNKSNHTEGSEADTSRSTVASPGDCQTTVTYDCMCTYSHKIAYARIRRPLILGATIGVLRIGDGT